jgi:hypothetical protein
VPCCGDVRFGASLFHFLRLSLVRLYIIVNHAPKALGRRLHINLSTLNMYSETQSPRMQMLGSTNDSEVIPSSWTVAKVRD